MDLSQILIGGEHEDFVPHPLAEQYAAVATRAGDCARLIVVPAVGDFETAGPFTSAGWFVRRFRGGRGWLCFGALGTETAGSIRILSSFCGIVGLKATFAPTPTASQ